ncbi:hypothetical protein [Streptomyces sp. NPDC001083]|uniref:hypothetical protein n=1 Tax=Streptomyces sp. NPDC001083 TaxID=3364545 RepID=UPI00368C9086
MKRAQERPRDHRSGTPTPSPAGCLPRTLLLGRYDDPEQLQYTGRTTTLTRTVSAAPARLFTSARAGRQWSFSAGWGGRETLGVTLIKPERALSGRSRG